MCLMVKLAVCLWALPLGINMHAINVKFTFASLSLCACSIFCSSSNLSLCVYQIKKWEQPASQLVIWSTVKFIVIRSIACIWESKVQVNLASWLTLLSTCRIVGGAYSTSNIPRLMLLHCMPPPAILRVNKRVNQLTRLGAS